MSKWRKKPVVIEAFKYEVDLRNPVGMHFVPEWAVEAIENNVMGYVGADLIICTLEGELKVDYGDYIIKGVKGELYPCKPDIFEMTYEKVDENE